MSANVQPQGQPEEPLPEQAGRVEPVRQPRFMPVVREAGAPVHWSPIFAGVLIAIGISIVLYALGAAFGFSFAPATAGGRLAGLLRGAAIWAGATWLISLFVGGYLAGRTGTSLVPRGSVLQGTVLWAIYTLVMLYAMSSLVGGALGAASNVAGPGAAAARGTAMNIPRALGTAATSAWIVFGGLVVGWFLAVLGGWLGVLGLRASEPRPAR